MGRKRKLWTRTIAEAGVMVRLYEREPGGVIYRDVWTGDTRDRKSLGHADRKLAEQQARELGRRLADLPHAGRTGAVAFGQLTGNALATLRATDVLLSRDQMLTALADVGAPIARADQWPHGALRFAAKFDRRGYESVVPLSGDARAALDVYLRQHPKAGDVPLLPSNAEPHRARGKIVAGRWLRRAENVPKLARGPWHRFRRQWASERRHLSPTDTMAAGGWRSFEVMRASYHQADAQGMLSVVESPESRPKSGEPGTPVAHAEAK